MITLLVLPTLVGANAPLPDSPRVTPIVRLIRRAEPSVVALFCVEKSGKITNGSGTIIHPDGFILTNNHVLTQDNGYALLKDDRHRKFRVIGRYPEKDLAVVRVEARRRLSTIPMGRSHDALIGEPVLVAGNPGGRGITFTAGILSSTAFLLGGPNALVMTQFPDSERETFLQFDAAANPGNSGGPLINMEGQIIGVVCGVVPKEQNSSHAIPIDRVRQFFPLMLEPEVRGGFMAGVELDPFEPRAVVTGLVANSPASTAGLRLGDVIATANGLALRHAPDWWLALAGKAAGGKLQLTVQRGKEQLAVGLTLGSMPFQPAVKVGTPVPGLRYRFYHGHFAKVPAFDRLTPVREGIVNAIDLAQLRGDRPEDYGLVLSGYLQIPQDGLYRLLVVSDDGCMVHLDGALAIDNDGAHPPRPMARSLRLAKGLHPLRIDYFQGKSGSVLELHLETEGKRQQVGADSLFHEEQDGPQPKVNPTGIRSEPSVPENRR